MKAVIGVLAAALLAAVLPARAAFDQTHALLTAELHKYVDHSLVHYKLWREHPEGLNRYLAELAAITPEEYEKFSENEKKALWINAYNALIIKIVLDHYPIHGTKSYYPPNSARQIPNLWDDYHYKVAGRDVNLYAIEHYILRKDFKDPRVHFAVVCASRGCPYLRRTAYTPATLDHDLDEAARRYMADPQHVQYDPENQTIRVSKLFQWFPLDFAQAAGYKTIPDPPPTDNDIVAAYVLSFAAPEVKAKFPDISRVDVDYMPYDWALNDAD